MKKIISSLGSIIMIGSSASVVACSISTETLTENTNEDAMILSSIYLRAYVLSAEQTVNGEYIDNHYIIDQMKQMLVSTYLDDVPSSSNWTINNFYNSLFSNNPDSPGNSDVKTHSGITPFSDKFETIYEYVPMIITILSQGLTPSLLTQLKSLIASFLPNDNSSFKNTMGGLAQNFENTDIFDSIIDLFEFKDYANYNDAFEDAATDILDFIDDNGKTKELIQGIIIILGYLSNIDFSYGTNEGDQPIIDGDHLFSATQTNEDYLSDIWENNDPNEDLTSINLTQIFNLLNSVISNDPDNWGINKLLSALGSSQATLLNKEGPGVKILIPIIKKLIDKPIPETIVSNMISDIVNNNDEAFIKIGNLDSKTIGDLAPIIKLIVPDFAPSDELKKVTIAQLLDQLIYQNSISDTVDLLSPGWNPPSVLYFLNTMTINDLLIQINNQFAPTASNPEDFTFSLKDISGLMSSFKPKEGETDVNYLIDKDEWTFMCEQYDGGPLSPQIDWYDNGKISNKLYAALYFFGLGNSPVILGESTTGMDEFFQILGLNQNDSFDQDSPLAYIAKLIDTNTNTGLHALIIIIGELIDDINSGEISNNEDNFMPLLYGTKGKNNDGSYRINYELNNDNWLTTNYVFSTLDGKDYITYNLTYSPIGEPDNKITYDIEISRVSQNMNAKWSWDEIIKEIV